MGLGSFRSHPDLSLSEMNKFDDGNTRPPELAGQTQPGEVPERRSPTPTIDGAS